MRTDDIIDGETGLFIRIGDPPTPVPEPFADLLRDYLDQCPNQNFAATGSTWLFPGRRAGRPMAPASIRERLAEVGVPLAGARHAALRQLVLQAPAPVVAGMLNYHHTTTTGAAHEAGSPWSHYAPDDHTP